MRVALFVLRFPLSSSSESRCKAAVAWAANEPLKVEEIEVAPPQKGEVRVKVIANALVRRMWWWPGSLGPM